MKKFSTIVVFILFALSSGVYTAVAQSSNWEDYGLTEQSVQFLTEEEKQEILNSKTPAQTEAYIQEQINEKGFEAAQEDFPFFGQFFDANTELEDVSTNPEILSCFDYYTFGSVEVDIKSSIMDSVAGARANFSGDIINKNPYPIVQGTLYVKIFKNIGTEKNSNGPDVVDQFIAVDNVTLSANGSIPFEFTWNIPMFATSGDYQVATYFMSDKKFNLLGLPFTDDVVGNTFNFSIDGTSSTVMFDKSSVVINDNPYYFAAYPPRIQADQDANISLDILNTTLLNQNTEITWKLYKWDQMHPDNFIREFKTNTFIEANSISTIELSVSELEEPVYLLVGELMYQDTKSIVNIRYVREGVDKVRLNFPAVTSYPLIGGEQSTVFACLHNAGQSDHVQNNTLILEVIDERGKIIESYTYEGTVTGDMMAVKKDFIPKNTLDNFSVKASLYTNGELVDESTLVYDCSLIDSSLCKNTRATPWIQIVTTLFGFIVLITILVFIKKRPKVIELVSLVFVLLVSMLFLDIVPSTLVAQHDNPLPADLVNPNIKPGSRQVIWSSTVNNTFEYHWSRWGETGGWANALKNPHVTVKYNAGVIDRDTGVSISNGDSVSVGTNLRLRFVPHHPYDIYWFGVGYSQDSPYGEWRVGAAPARVSCEAKDFVTKAVVSTIRLGSFTMQLSTPFVYDVYIPLVLNFPDKNINTSNLSCGTIQGNEVSGFYKDCTVVAPGQITASFDFQNISGYFYYRYYDYRDFDTATNNEPAGCYGNNIPLRTSSQNPYILQVPAQTISYTLTATETQSPTISLVGPPTGKIGESYNFTVFGTDPDGDTVRYGIDWNDDDIINQWVPASGYVASGTSQLAPFAWAETGTYTIKARTQDSNGLFSDWASHIITITEGNSSSQNQYYCQASTSGTIPNTPVTFTAYPSGDTYKWLDADGTTISTDRTITQSFSSTGVKTMRVLINDIEQTCSVTIETQTTPPDTQDPSTLNPDDAYALFRFNPDIAGESDNTCRFETPLTQEELASCTFTNRTVPYKGPDLVNRIGIRPGLWTLTCGEEEVTRQCTSNPLLNEN